MCLGITCASSKQVSDTWHILCMPVQRSLLIPTNDRDRQPHSDWFQATYTCSEVWSIDTHSYLRLKGVLAKIGVWVEVLGYALSAGHLPVTAQVRSEWVSRVHVLQNNNKQARGKEARFLGCPAFMLAVDYWNGLLSAFLPILALVSHVSNFSPSVSLVLWVVADD